jgi:F420-dependent oxidoreductase-like protein
MVEGQEGVDWGQWLALAKACEDAGLDSLFRSDHYASMYGRLERGSLEPWTTLAALAAVTERIRLGTLVSPATFRHPSELARIVTTVDHVSRGRVELGLGAGWYELEHRLLGFPFPEKSTRLELFAEQLEIVHRQWTEQVFDFTGRHYQLEGCRAEPKPLQRPRPPLIVGGKAWSGTTVPAARFADEYNVAFHSPARCREARARVDRACEAVGREPATMTFSLMTCFVVGRDTASLLESTRRAMECEAATGDAEEFLASKRDDWIVGTIPQVVAKLRELEAAGVQRVYLQHLDHENLDAVALIGAEILPALAARPTPQVGAA